MTEGEVGRLAEIRERADKATPGPWLDDEDGRDDILPMLTVWPVSQPDDGCEERGYLLGQPIHIAHAVESRDQEFIAHSREDVPYLLSVIDSLTAERDRMKDDLLRLEWWEATCGYWHEQANSARASAEALNDLWGETIDRIDAIARRAEAAEEEVKRLREEGR